LTPEQIHQAVVELNVDLLNEVATQRKLPGCTIPLISTMPVVGLRLLQTPLEKL
jgi:hypothetical protein